MTPVKPPTHQGGEIELLAVVTVPVTVGPLMNVKYAETQPEYNTLPVSRDGKGVLMTEWELDDAERALIAAGGRVRLWLHTFNKPLTPLSMEIATP